MASVTEVSQDSKRMRNLWLVVVDGGTVVVDAVVDDG